MLRPSRHLRSLASMPIEDEGLYPDEPQRESIRPSVRELNADAATYDADALEWPPSAKVSKGIAPPTIGQARTGASSGKGKGKSVRISQPTEDDVRYYEPAPRSREDMAQRADVMSADDDAGGGNLDNMTPGRFVLPLQGEEGDTADPSASFPSTRPLPSMPSLPMVGGIQERKAARSAQPSSSSSSSSRTPSLPTGTSRFKAIKQAEKERASSSSTSSSSSSTSRQRAPPVVQAKASQMHDVLDSMPRPQRDASVAKSTDNKGDDADEWLDEDGNVMSAFRRARLQRQGLEPPGGRRRTGGGASKQPAVAAKATSTNAPPLQPPGRTASPSPAPNGNVHDSGSSAFASDEHAAMLREISSENQRKVSAMKAEDVASDLRDLESLFGKDVLEGLRNRGIVGNKATATAGTEGQTSTKEMPSSDESAAPQKASDSTAEDISPPKPATSEAAQAGTSPSTPTSKHSPLSSILFDSMGKLLPIPSRTPATHHHHATDDGETGEAHAHPHYGADPSDPDREGYTVESLLLLCRSTIAGQRIMALQMIARVCSFYPPHMAESPEHRKIFLEELEPGSVPPVAVVSALLRDAETHLDTALVSTMLLTDRQRSVRHAALSTLRTALLFGNIDAWVRKGDAPSSLQRLLDAGLFAGLANVLQDEGEIVVSRELVVQILLQLICADRAVANRLLDFNSGKLVAALVQHCLKVHWPPADPSSSRLPSASCATILHELVRSSRVNAEKLIKRDVLDALLRFVAVGPWTIATKDTDNDKTRVVGRHEQRIGFELLAASLEIYHSLARYGMYASLVSRAWELLEPIRDWIRDAATSTKTALPSAASHFYRLLAMWTTCAIDPHQTTPGHEVTWSQVEEWVDPSLDLLEALAGKRGDGVQVDLFAAVCEHLVAWLQCAARNGPVRRADAVERLRAVGGRLEDVVTELEKSWSQSDTGRAVDVDGSSDSDDSGDDGGIASQRSRIGSTCEALYQLLSLSHSIEDESLSSRVVASVTAEGTHGMLLDILLHLEDGSPQHQAVATLLVSIAASTSPSAQLQLLSRLRPGEETLVLRTIDMLLSQAAGEADAQESPQILASLRPFFAECLGIRPNAKTEANRLLRCGPARPTPGDLKRTMSLWTDDGSDNEEDENDPVTGSALWKSPASRGLPLRPDWPLLALDDLLRSGDSAVFNRADNLPEDWDPNERQVVEASLLFSNWCCRCSTPPSGLTSTHLYLAAQKVFMLESGIQGDLRKWTGALTGKDLFRDPAIVPHLRELLSGHANALARREATTMTTTMKPPPPTLTLDTLAPLHFGSETSYYSFYTDFIGLYDSISYGDALFALALLPPLAVEGYPIDYRRLVWKDYGHLLPTIRVSIDDAPSGGIAAFLSSPTSSRESTEMLQAYTSAVLEGRVVPGGGDRQGILWRVAVHHIAMAIWAGEGGGEGNEASTSRARSLAKAIFSQGSEVLQRDVLAYDDGGGGGGTEGKKGVSVSEETLEQRRRWLRSECGLAQV